VFFGRPGPASACRNYRNLARWTKIETSSHSTVRLLLILCQFIAVWCYCRTGCIGLMRWRCRCTRWTVLFMRTEVLPCRQWWAISLHHTTSPSFTVLNNLEVMPAPSPRVFCSSDTKSLSTSNRFVWLVYFLWFMSWHVGVKHTHKILFNGLKFSKVKERSQVK